MRESYPDLKRRLEKDDWPEYAIVKDDIRRLDMEHLRLSKELNAAAAAVKSDPSNRKLQARLDRLKKKIEAVGKKLDGSLNMYR